MREMDTLELGERAAVCLEWENRRAGFMHIVTMSYLALFKNRER